MSTAQQDPALQMRRVARANAHGRTIAIIGAGFSGTALAMQLLRRRQRPGTRILLIDRSRETGRGVAYTTRDYPYLLNVPAAQMSALPDRPGDFLEFAGSRGCSATPHDFLPRALYGEYLETRLAEAVQRADSGTRFTRIVGEAVRVHASIHQWNVVLADGRDLLADDIVLALGNPSPRRLSELDPIAAHAGYVHDPWAASRSLAARASNNGRRERVLLLGTGLTMADVTLGLAGSARPPAEIHALSFRALLHAPQSNFDRCAAREEDRAVLSQAQGSLRHLVRAVRSLAHETQARGDDWRSVVALVRGQLPELWQQLSDAERRRFLRHVRPYWDVHRHRVPPAVAKSLENLRDAGILREHAGRLLHAEPVRKGLQVIWRNRHGGQEQAAIFDQLINCTGPDYSVAASREPLVRALLADGLIKADAHGLGIATTANAQVIGANGRPVTGLHCVGPWLRARFWEATAVPELRVHAERLATELARGARERPQVDFGIS